MILQDQRYYVEYLYIIGFSLNKQLFSILKCYLLTIDEKVVLVEFLILLCNLTG